MYFVLGTPYSVPGTKYHLQNPRTPRLLSAFVALLTVTATLAADWPQWRGLDGTGVSQDKGVPIVWHEQRSIVWKCPLPEWGASTPAIWGEAIFVTSQSAEGKLLVVRIDRTSGKIAWTKEVGSGMSPRGAPKRSTQKFHELHNLASPSPVTDGKIVVVHFGNGDLAAYDFAGEQLWKRNLQDDDGVYSIWYGHANSPVIAGVVVISVCMQDSLAGLAEKPRESYVVAHDLRSGAVRWKTPRATKADAEQCDSYTTPLLCKLNLTRQLIVMGGNQLDAYDPVSGKQLWHLPGLIGGRTVTGPTIDGGVIYTTRGLRGALIAVKPKPTGELTFRDILWSATEGTPDTCCPVVVSGLVFTISDDGIARCYLASNGNLKWKERLKGKYKASPVAVDGRILILNTDGLCTVVSAAPRFNKLVENQLKDETLASPAIANGQIFIRGRKSLYCIGR